MSNPNTKELKLPAKFDPAKHAAIMERKVKEELGSDWSISHIDKQRWRLVAVRHTSMTSINDEGETVVLELANGTKMSDAPAIAARFEKMKPGYYLTKFEPFLKPGRATMQKFDKATKRARGAVANALGVQPWYIVITTRPDGGYDLELPDSYTPSKHDEKLEEVATDIVGGPGWFTRIDPRSLEASIIPSDPPTFSQLIPYPTDAKVTAFAPGSKEWAKIPLGERLPAPGEKHGETFIIDFESGMNSQVGGTSNSGKDLHVDEWVPTTTGHKRVGDLTTGDMIFAIDGTPTKIVGFSERHRSRELFRLTFDDGQETLTGRTHQWLASTRLSRDAHVASRVKRREDRLGEYEAKADHYRQLRDQAQPGLSATLEQISMLAGEPYVTTARGLDIPSSMANIGFVSVGRPATEHNVLDLNDSTTTPLRFSGRDFSGQLSGFPEWSTAREIADGLALHLLGRNATLGERQRLARSMNRRGVRTRLGASHKKRVNVYPVDEVFNLLAERADRLARTSDSGREVRPLETLTDTATMMGSLKDGWAVRMPEALSLPAADLPIDPYVLGAWLGDGTSRNGQITADTNGGQESDHTAMRQAIEATGYETHSIRDPKIIAIDCLGSQLRECGLIQNKHVPISYLRASAEQRLGVLQGLMDTDGTIDRQGSCELALSDERLATDALELIRSLGIKAAKHVSKAGYRNSAGNYVACQDRHRINFSTDQPVFRLGRKAERLPNMLKNKLRWVHVKSVEKVSDSATTRCVKIAHPSHVFLTGRGFLPTHNSVFLNDIVAGVLARGAELAIIDTAAKAVDFEWCKEYVRPEGWGCESIDEAAAVMSKIYAEGDKRAKVLKEYGVQNWTQLPADAPEAAKMRPIFLIMDEVTGLWALETVPKGLDKEHPMRIEAQDTNTAKEILKLKYSKTAAEMRFVGIKLVLSSQVASTDTGIGTALRTNHQNKILLGVNPTEGNRKLVFPDPAAVPKVPEHIRSNAKVGKGVGTAANEGDEACVFKPYYASTHELGDFLKKRRVPVFEGQRPTRATMEQFVPTSGPADDGDETAKRRKKMEAEAMIDPETGEKMTPFEYANKQKQLSVRKGDADEMSGETS